MTNQHIQSLPDSHQTFERHALTRWVENHVRTFTPWGLPHYSYNPDGEPGGIADTIATRIHNNKPYFHAMRDTMYRRIRGGKE